MQYYKLCGVHEKMYLSSSCYRRGKVQHSRYADTYLRPSCWVQVYWSLRLLKSAFAKIQHPKQWPRYHHHCCSSATTPDLSLSTAGAATD